MQNEIFAQNIYTENTSEINLNILNQNKQWKYIHVDG